ncbi:MFS general substrate transporter [Zalerion maritima]|uniref:MFS general substrate transporter n=1 Tax=Zalerion maritima TaxID=339359 RepID=A0AAD5RJ30_9PEZI|nr:MFS general substrate transporter [Zalerion maritima]
MMSQSKTKDSESTADSSTDREGPNAFQSPEIDIEKLGRSRPPVFKSALAEYAFCFSAVMSIAMSAYFISGFHTVLPELSTALSIPDGLRTWPSSVLSLVAGSFLLSIGRMADIYGGYLIYNAGFVFLTVFSVACGFSPNYWCLIAFRGLQGLGAAAILPGGIMLIGKIYRPGLRKNIVFGVYGSTAVLGLFLGIMMGGMSGEFLSWRAYFWIGAGVCVISSIFSLVSIPRDYAEARSRKIAMDWLGSFTIVPGLCLIVYAFTDASNASRGWLSPQILVTLILGLFLLAAGVYIEGWVATSPLVPGEVFKVKYMKRMMFCLFVDYGIFGLYLFYSNFYIEIVLGKSPLTTAIWFLPWAVSGTILACTGGLLLHCIPGRYLLILSGIAKIVAVLLFAIMPDNPSYWAFVFPAMLAETLFSDIIYTVTNVFITTSLPGRLQGVAGALINCALYVGCAFFLALADMAVNATAHMGEKASFKAAFWVGVAMSSIALVVLCTMDIGSAKSDLTADEKMMRESTTGLASHGKQEQQSENGDTV